ncbi:hypothetical protein ALC62_07738, partial [Cyphomyrmex costatus]
PSPRPYQFSLFPLVPQHAHVSRGCVGARARSLTQWHTSGLILHRAIVSKRLLARCRHYVSKTRNPKTTAIAWSSCAR